MGIKYDNEAAPNRGVMIANGLFHFISMPLGLPITPHISSD